MDSRGFARSALLRSCATRNCFLSFPHNWSSFISFSSLPSFSIESSKSSLIVTWSGATHDCPNNEEEFVSINGNLIALSGFIEDEMVVVKQVSLPPLCKQITVKVSSFSEWEELLLNIEEVQDAFLNQIRVISHDQTVPIWLPGGSFVNIKIVELCPSLICGLLLENTQMKVLAPNEDVEDEYSSTLPAKLVDTDIKLSNKDEKDLCPMGNTSNVFYNFFKGFIYSRFGIPVRTPFLQDVDLTLRVTPFPSMAFCDNLPTVISEHPTMVIINKDTLSGSKFEDDLYFVAKIRKINYDKEEKNDNLNSKSQDIYVIVMVWQNLLEKNFLQVKKNVFAYFNLILKQHFCIVSNPLRRQFEIRNKSIINLSTYDCNFSKIIKYIDCYPFTQMETSDQLVSHLQNLVVDICDSFPIILNPFSLLSFSLNNEFSDVMFINTSKSVVMVDKMLARMIHIRLVKASPASLPFVHKSIQELDETPTPLCHYLVNKTILEAMKERVIQSMNMELESMHLRPEFILLSGSKGSGRTFLCKTLINELSRMPHNFYCELLKLKKLKGKKIESVQKCMKEAVRKAIFHQPSLIVFDDLDLLVPKISEIDSDGSSESSTHLALMFKSLLQQIRSEMENRSYSFKSHPCKMHIVVLATTISFNSLHKTLSSVQGSHLFSSHFTLPPFMDEQRLSFFESLLLKFCENLPTKIGEINNTVLNYDKKIALQSLSGLVLSDIQSLALRVHNEAKSRMKNPHSESCFARNFSYNDEDIQEATVNFITLSQKALQEPATTNKKINVGGLALARKLLQETIDWPSRFPKLFKQASLRLRSGILLYGPPGCGKTNLINYIAKNSSLNFISVKGPELLSKYIGQSEKAIRDAFERAQASKPCILFFDEFDSIAPRRGLDNTGVTDRVVNQLLTQMDGVEGLSGVFVLAATSRPDLIDPALLRPGRLDKCVHCPMPTVEEREEILLVLSEDMKLKEEIDWHTLAILTEGYTGADLQGILSTAQIKAVQEYLGDSLYEGVLDSVTKPNESDQLHTKNEIVPSSNENSSLLSNELFDNGKLIENYASNITDDGKSVLKLKETSSQNESFGCKDIEVALNPNRLYVKQEHFYEALKEVQPSIKKADCIFYENLYNMFTASREKKTFVAVTPGKVNTFA